jgi:HTH-like domain/Integrase core domain
VNLYPFIEAEKHGGYGVKRACELLQVSRAAYYAHRGSGRSARERADAELVEQIRHVHAESGGTYGAPRIHAELRDRGRRHGRKRVARLMRTAGVAGRCPKRWRRTTVPDPAAATRADLIGRDFRADAAALDARWCGDVTYVRTWEGWLYLATVIDIASRRVVGWATADHLRTDLVEAALTNAVRQRRPPAGVVFHSDRGCQGGIKRSSQHLGLGGVDGTAAGLDNEDNGQSADAVAGAASAQARDRATVLDQDRAGVDERGRRGRVRRVAAGGSAVVPPRWRDAADQPRFPVGTLPVVRRAGGDRVVDGAGVRGTRDRAAAGALALDDLP